MPPSTILVSLFRIVPMAILLGTFYAILFTVIKGRK